MARWLLQETVTLLTAVRSAMPLAKANSTKSTCKRKSYLRNLRDGESGNSLIAAGR